MTPRAARAIVVAGACVAVGIAAAGRLTSDAAPGDEVRVTYVYSTDARTMLEPLIARFNSESHRAGGREIEIVGAALSSGEAEAAIRSRHVQAALWTPASSLWGGLLNHKVGSPWAPRSDTSLVFSPQVIAMWKPLAQALGYPRADIGWTQIRELATSPEGWAAYGKPEFGRFRLGHTNPDFSTSGISAVASEYYTVTGKRSGLNLADVRRPDVSKAVQAIERSIVHYGKTAEDITDRMDEHGLHYAHAVYTQETTVREFNEDREQDTELVAIVPSDGTFIADYPLLRLSAPWVTPEQRRAAEAFGDWLVPRITLHAAEDSGFRLRRPDGLVTLEMPGADVLDAMRTAWHRDRKPANIVLVVDRSASMGGADKIDAARQGLLSFVRELSPEDRVALVSSGDRIATDVELGASGSRAAVTRAVRGMLATPGDEPIYPAISSALRDVRGLGDSNRINAIVVLSDGASTSRGRAQLLRELAEVPPTEGTSVRIFTVAYGKGADVKALEDIAAASGGESFAGTPGSIMDIYLRISAYF